MEHCSSPSNSSQSLSLQEDCRCLHLPLGASGNPAPNPPLGPTFISAAFSGSISCTKLPCSLSSHTREGGCEAGQHMATGRLLQGFLMCIALSLVLAGAALADLSHLLTLLPRPL